MAIYPEDMKTAKQYLWSEETVEVTATQRMNPEVGGAIINPTTVIATDKRLLIINKEALRIRKDVESIPYNRIASVRYESGFISASVFIVVAGYVSPPGEQGFLKRGESEGEIGGLHKEDAKALSDFVQKMISGVIPAEMLQESAGNAGAGRQQGGAAPSGAYLYCSKCGTRNGIDSKFCSNCGAQLSK